MPQGCSPPKNAALILVSAIRVTGMIPGQKRAHTSACMYSQAPMSSKTYMCAHMCACMCSLTRMCACICACMCSKLISGCMCSQFRICTGMGYKINLNPAPPFSYLQIVWCVCVTHPPLYPTPRIPSSLAWDMLQEITLGGAMLFPTPRTPSSLS